MLILALLWAAGLAALCGYVWLVVMAFRWSTLWGLLVLLLSPFSAAAFAIGHWKRAQTALTFHVGGVLTMLILMLAFAPPTNLDALASAERGKSPPQARAGAQEPAARTDSDAPPPSVATAETTDEIASEPVRARPALRVRSQKPAKPERDPDPPLGMWIEIIDTNDRLHVGTLLMASAEELVLERPLQGGAASYAIPRREIVSIYAKRWR